MTTDKTQFNTTGMASSQNESFIDMTKSMSQWYDQMSLTSITVPKFGSSKDVYDFITEFEDSTSTLLDDHKVKLLYKCFPPGQHRSWFENEIKPRIKKQESWSTIKSVIIDRFSLQVDRDRHFTRILEMRYDPDGLKLLQDFMDDFIYSFKKAHNNIFNEESCIRFIKNSLPQKLHVKLSDDSKYRDAVTVADLRAVAKRYDLNKQIVDNSVANRTNTELGNIAKELAAIRKELDGTKQELATSRREQELTRSTLAAVTAPRPSRRSQSPRHRYQGSPHVSRSPSPQPYSKSQRAFNKPYSRSDKEHNYRPGPNPDPPVDKPLVVMNSQSYFNEFGIPTRPCKVCNEGAWHFDRHCYSRLKSLN